MKSNKKLKKKSKNELKVLGILFFILIFPTIINPTLLYNLNRNINDRDSLEEDLKKELNTSNSNDLRTDYFKYYKSITIDHTKVFGSSDLINFPILISIIDSDLRNYVQPDGDDIAFFNGSVWLDHEIEVFNQMYNATHAQLIAWVGIPSLSTTTDTILYMYFSNSTMESHENSDGVWNDHYIMVQHLEETSGSHFDSTSNNNDGTISGPVDQSAIGKIDGADGFGGIDDKVVIPQSTTLILKGPFTIEMWVKINSFPDTWHTLFSQGHCLSSSGEYIFSGPSINIASDNSFIFEIYNDTDRDIARINNFTWNFDQWYHLVCSFDGTANNINQHIYVDSIEYAYNSTGTNQIANTGHEYYDFCLGLEGIGDNYDFDGIIDEVRIFNTNMSGDWIKTEYINQYDPSSFYSIGSSNRVKIPSFSDFKYYKDITIDHTKIAGSGNHVNFPVLISIYDSELHNYAQPDGDDIAFSNGTDWLDHEIEVFNQSYSSTHAHLVAWVRIPSLSTSTDTIIQMYYGNSIIGPQENPAGVWNTEEYEFVHHLHNLEDSTSANYDGTKIGSTSTNAGLINGAYKFNGIGDYIKIMYNPSQNCRGMSFWVKYNSIPIPSGPENLFALSGSYKKESRLYMGTKNGYLLFGMGNGVSETFDYLDTDVWYHMVMSSDGNYAQGYLNGQSNGPSFSYTIDPNTAGYAIGSISHEDDLHSDFINGTLEEVRVLNVQRSTDWITTEYNNQIDPNSFYSLSSAKLVYVPTFKDYKYFKIITIDHTKVFGTGIHKNFPVLISTFDSDLHDDVLTTGEDLAFANETDWLDYEIEVFNQNYNFTHAQLVVWVRIPSLSTSTDTILYMYYGNSSLGSLENRIDVWDNRYMGLWHLSESDNNALDSTSYETHGTLSGGVNQGTVGQIYRSYEFDGEDDQVLIGNPSDDHLDFGTESFTVSYWINFDQSTGDYQIPLYKGGNMVSKPGYEFETTQVGTSLDMQVSDGTRHLKSSQVTIIYDTWLYITGVVDRTQNKLRIYKNGMEVGSGTDISALGSLVNDYDLKFSWNWYAIDGILDEVRIIKDALSSDWIATEYSNQHDPDLFHTIGMEFSGYNVEINAIDLYGNFIPNVNISAYKNNQLIRSEIANNNGNVVFTNLPEQRYNFTVSMTSNIENHFEIINKTIESILLEDSINYVNLICNVSTNFFQVKDIDGDPIDSGWIIVGNSTHNIQNCPIDIMGNARFWWLNTTPYQYNYSVYYQDTNYYMNTLNLASGDITTVNSLINLSVNLTTVNFKVWTLDTLEPISGVKLILRVNNTSGESIVNLTTDVDGKATLRWLDSSGINGNYSLQIMFFGQIKSFNITGINMEMANEVNFSVEAKATLDIWVQISLENFQTQIISLNPTNNIVLEWGSELKLRALFNITKAGGLPIIGPSDADKMSYRISEGENIVLSGIMLEEIENIGRYHITINTEELECEINYLITISAYKSGFTLPSDIPLTLYLLRSDLILNQSQNDDSSQNIYWSENLNMSVKPYGETYERFTIEDDIFQNMNHSFKFSIPDVKNDWKLSRVVFHIYNITFGVSEGDINLNITDDFGVKHIFNSGNSEYYYSGQWNSNGRWSNIEVVMNNRSVMGDNTFNFLIEGTFVGEIDIIYEAYFVRDKISIQFSKFNLTDNINIFTAIEGWAIQSITFDIYNCYYTSNWSKVDLSTLTNLNISTNEGFKYSLDSGDIDGNGILIIDDRIIYPYGNQFLFTIEDCSNIIFDTNISVEYIQGFYKNQHLETYNLSKQESDIVNGGSLHISVIDRDWDNEEAILWIKDIFNGTTYFLPSELGMNITIGGQTYIISDTPRGEGIFLLNNLIKDTIHTAIIDTILPVNFTLSFMISYVRVVNYETIGTITFIIRERPDIGGPVQYYSDLGYYLQTINTSLIDAGKYTVRFTVSKDHYISVIKDLELEVMNRLTLINGDSEFYRTIEEIYIKDAINFTFLYTDALIGSNITNLQTKFYVWEKYSSNGSVVEQGQGEIFVTADDLYILDFDTEMKTLGEYLLIATLDKDNYDYKNVMILLSIVKREMDYSIGDNIKNNQISVVQGNAVPIEIQLTDPTKASIPLTNATVSLIINGITYEFGEFENGTYLFNLRTDNINAFFTSETLVGIMNITKEDYISVQFSITIVVEMEEIFPGIPKFYFLLILFSILASISGIVGYRVYKHATIPTFVKKARGMQKAIKRGNVISESLLYQSKEAFIGEIVRDKWVKLGLSLGDILGIEIEKSRKLPKIIRERTRIERAGGIKPKGLLLMKWDERIGTELLARYPEDISVSNKTLMQVYSTHEYTGEIGVITLTTGLINILSYYTGPDSGYYIILLLNLDDDPDAYEGALANVAQIILQNIADDSYLELIPMLFQRISVYPNLSDEQNLAFYYLDELKRMIINVLEEYGAISKSELAVWLKEKYAENFFDLQAILNEFVKRDFIKLISVKGAPSELILFVKDIFMLRIPPINILENPANRGLPAQFTKKYRTEVREYFEKYIPSEEDDLKVIDILIDPQAYETLRLLRTSVGTINNLEKLKKKGVDNIYSALKKLYDAQMIKVYKDDNGTEYYALASDIYIDLIFPKYLLNVIKVAYEQKSKSNKELLEYLGVLENAYYDLKSKKKKNN